MPRKNASYKGPTPSALHDPLLLTLGEHTQLTAGVCVSPLHIYKDTLKAMGFDPDNLPWEMAGSKVNAKGKRVYKAGVRHRIRRAFGDLLSEGLAQRGEGEGRLTWGLTTAGVEQAGRLLQGVFDLDILTEPLLHSLGEATLYKTKGAPDKRWMDKASTMVTLPQDSHPIIEKALAQMESQGLVQQKRNRWLLTLKGIEEAVALRSKYAPDRNVTVFWLNSVLNHYYPQMERHLSAKYPRSRDFNEIFDLVNEYLTNLMDRDGLRKRIVAGKFPSASQLCHWACRQACSQFRNEGRDAHTRSFKGALTERDRRHLQSMSEGGPQDLLADTMIVADHDPIYLQMDNDGRQGALPSRSMQNAPLMDVCGGDLEDEVSIRLSKEYGFQVIEGVIRKHKKGAPDRYVRLARAYMLEGSDINDIARMEGVTRNRAASLVSTIRHVLAKAQAAGELDEIPAIFF